METGLETKVAFGDMMQAFEAFKDANDERLEQIEKRMSADVTNFAMDSDLLSWDSKLLCLQYRLHGLGR